MARKKSIQEEAIQLHKRLGGKIEITSKAELKTPHDLAVLYTPGVGAVSSLLGTSPARVREYTIKKNTVAVISDGSAVLGLGDIGPEGALPVLEGKCVLFKKFAGVDAFPIALATRDPDEIIRTVKAIAPVFGGINLEDISAPRCFQIEERLKRELSIPVMHDDQHGTAIVVFAALLNALTVVDKKLLDARIVINGAGPAGTAAAYILKKGGAGDVIVLDSQGILSKKRPGLTGYKKTLADATNPRGISGDLKVALRNADVFVGVSRAGLLSAAHIRSMAHRPIIFALANPTPEIMPDEALKGGAYIVATGRSDFPNQINNALVFPGVFRGALDNAVRGITDTMKIRAAHSLARLIKKPSRIRIIPSIFDKRVVPTVARAIR